MKRDNVGKLAFYGLLLLFSGCVLWLNFYNTKVLNILAKEDGLVEWLTSIFYFLASGFFVLANKENRFKNVFFWFLAAMCFAVAGEEISWGQRVFDIATPTSLEHINVQQEFNLHNINGVHQIVRMVGVLIVSTICYFIPILNWKFPKFKALCQKWNVPIFPLWLMGLVTVSLLFMIVPRYVFHVNIFNIDEIAEVQLALAFLLYSLSYAPIGYLFPSLAGAAQKRTPVA